MFVCDKRLRKKVDDEGLYPKDEHKLNYKCKNKRYGIKTIKDVLSTGFNKQGKIS